MSAHPLDRLVERETFREILALLEPEELMVVALRLEGLSDSQIGVLLDITQSTVGRRIEQACRRIIQQLPEAAPLLQGRRQSRQRPFSNETPPLEHGWLCGWTPHESLPDRTADLTTQDVAKRYRVKPQTVTRWIREGRFPHAYRRDGQLGDYRIPERDLAGFGSSL